MKYLPVSGGKMTRPIDKINKRKKRKLVTSTGLAEAFIFITVVTAGAVLITAALDMWLH